MPSYNRVAIWHRFQKFIYCLSLLLIASLYASISHARPVIADLSLRQIEIDSSFTGTDILLFGARNDPGDIVVVVRGPEMSYIVRKKERKVGIWANTQKLVLDNVNGFFTIAANRPLADIQNNYLLESLQIGTGNTILPKGHDSNIENEFKEAFLQKQQDEKLYLPEIAEVSLIGDTLFRTIIRFPENIVRGVYTAEIYLFSDGQLSGVQSTPIVVSKKGFDALIYDFAHKLPIFYGFTAVIIALFAGWEAGLIFKRV